MSHLATMEFIITICGGPMESVAALQKFGEKDQWYHFFNKDLGDPSCRLWTLEALNYNETGL